MSNFRKYLMGIIMILAATMSLSGLFASTAYGDNFDSVNPSVQLNKGDNTIAQLVVDINTTLKTDKSYNVNYNLLQFNTSSGLLYWNVKGYSTQVTQEKREIMKTTLGAVQQSSVYRVSKMKMYNFIADRDTGVSKAIRILSTDAGANVNAAANILSPVFPVFGTLTGVICVVGFMLIALSISIDMFYMVVPMARMFLDKTNGSGKPHLISLEAYNAVKRSTAEAGTAHWSNYLVIYVKTRIVTLFVAGALLVAMVTSKIWSPILFFFDMF